MELDVILSSAKWKLLTELAKEPQSPLELSKIFNTTLANISQQLRLIEAYGVVDKEKISNHEKGKPRTVYSIKKDVNYLIKLGKKIAAKKILDPEPFNIYSFNVLAAQPKKDHFYMLKFFWENTDILSGSSIGLLKNSDEALDFFVITEDLENARAKLSELKITSPSGSTRKIVCWTHNSNEVKEGLEHNNPYFINLVKKSSTLLDNGDILEEFKGGA